MFLYFRNSIFNLNISNKEKINYYINKIIYIDKMKNNIINSIKSDIIISIVINIYVNKKIYIYMILKSFYVILNNILKKKLRFRKNKMKL